MNQFKFPHLQKLSVRQILFWGFALIFAAGLFFFVRHLTACWQLTALPGIPPSYCAVNLENSSGMPDLNIESTPNAEIPATPEVEAPQVELPQWDGASRINIVFFGLRGGDMSGADCPVCTDTIIVLTVDPVTKTAGMLSIPRDLFVNIPGFGFSRINTAWTLGERAKLPGGGPGLAMKTVSQFIGVPIQYYVQVDFETFVSLINLIGGVDIYSDEKLILDPSGSGQDHFVLTCCGMRHLNGLRALAYARCREESRGCSDSDLGRAKRQQKVIMAVRDKLLDPEYFPKFLAQAPQLYETFSSGIHTNMSLEDAMKLAVLAKDIPIESIKQGVINDDMISYENFKFNGVPASVLRPVPDLIRVLRDEIFVPGGPLSPLAQGDSLTLMQSDAARIRVVNNTTTPDLDERTANFLTAQGMQVVERGVPTVTSDRTVLVLYSPKLYALRYLVDTFGVTRSNQIIFKPDSAETVDIEIRIGQDWVDRLPLGY
jgi:polyisoprenyl-teichoic acid--peptidoglycan teichoic acid transferase